MILIEIPTHWSPDQALAVHECLHHLLEAIWEHYEQPLIESLTVQSSQPPTERAQLELFEFNDEVPF